jgi:hypothetical protein
MKKLILIAVIGVGTSVGHCSEVASFSLDEGGKARTINIPGNSYDAQIDCGNEMDIGAGCCGIGLSEFLAELSTKLATYRANFSHAVRCVSELVGMLREVRRVVTAVTRHNSVDYIPPDKTKIIDRNSLAGIDDPFTQILDIVDRELSSYEDYGDTLQPLPYGFPLGSPYVGPDEKLAIAMLQYIADVVDSAKAAD